jgi:hypothetical protein
MGPSCGIAALVILLIPIAVAGAGAQDTDDTKPEEAAAASDTPVFGPLYASFVALQALDVVSTWHAANEGRAEANPFLRAIAPNRPALIAVKSAQTVGTLWLTQRLRKKHRVAAIALVCGLDSAYAVVVARNFRHTR